MDNAVRHSLADRAFLFDDPDAYLAGVDAALEALEQVDTDNTAEEQRSPAPTRA